MAFHENATMNSEAGGYHRTVLREYISTCDYGTGLCHLCVAKENPEDERYGPSIENNFESYLDQVMFDLKVDQRTARAEVLHVLGLSRWRRESTLYGLVREIFPGNQVLREASPQWLGRMRLDIYLPELRLAVEHHGEQHYRPLAVFGGEEAHTRVVERDALKRRLCAENGVEVVDFRFDSALTKASVRQRLRKHLGEVR
jgi:very-short-patch-repair endonuclease